MKVRSNLIFFAFSLLLFTSDFSFGQGKSGLVYKDDVFDRDIATVTFHPTGSPLAVPIVDLNAGEGALHLGFDQLLDDVSDFSYTIIHCNHDWTPSQLRPNEYLDAFTDDRITSFFVSRNVFTQYFHYDLYLPNRQIKWSKSGNYILKIYYEYENQQIVLTRRFVVVERGWDVASKLVPAANVSKRDTHHEIDFSVFYTNTRIADPRNDLATYVLQNGDWETQIGPLQPSFLREGEAVYDYQDSISFAAGKEFRFFDTRVLDTRGWNVQHVERVRGGWDVWVNVEQNRAYKPYLFQHDINGNFVIGNRDRESGAFSYLTPDAEQAFRQGFSGADNRAAIESCDYALVHFYLSASQPFEDSDVYVVGKMTDWQHRKDFRMKYDEKEKVYVGKAFLKQGYYNYRFDVVNQETGVKDPDGVEGNWYETTNDYTILTYYRPFGARYDRAMVGTTIGIDIRRN